MSREVLGRLLDQLGDLVTQVDDPGGGWPGLVSLGRGSDGIHLAIHIAAIGLSHRGRDDVERRFQNPAQGKPVTSPEGYFPLLLGFWDEGEEPVLVAMEVTEHRLTAETRQSYFVPLGLLRAADAEGWAEHISTSGERLVALDPRLLPSYVDAQLAQVQLPPDDVVSIAATAGLRRAAGQESMLERVRREVTALARSAAFSRAVLEAYSGSCAMCGLGLGLVEAAHIYPVQARDSADRVWNGMALCPTHHRAFDKHLVWVGPESLDIALHPSLSSVIGRSEAERTFIRGTLQRLQIPAEAARPDARMFERRYEFFKGEYDWHDSEDGPG